MKVVAYSIKSVEKEFLAKANQKKHDITLIANPLSLDTALYAYGKDVVIVYINDDLSYSVIGKLEQLGIKYIIARSAETGHLDKAAVARLHIKIANVANGTDQEIANETIHHLDVWQQNKSLGGA
jgi:D-lactate dehydrogenase